jgi:putative acetyltransferase
VKIGYFERRGTSDVGEVSVFDNAEALQSFVSSVHGSGLGGDVVAPPTDAATPVAWWVADRHEPTIDEANSRLDFLREHGPSPYAFPPMQMQPQLTIERVWLDNAEVQLLIANLNADLYSRYPEPGALVFSLESADIVNGVGALLMAVLDELPVGCGAFRVLDDQPGSVEIKRMYVTLAGRGKKIGAALLAELEQGALALGIERFVLETGPRQLEALQRYGRAGYVVCEPWGEFIGKDLSICMEKRVPR